MLKNFKTSLCVGLAATFALGAGGFALLGPFEGWQSADIGYNPLGGEIGGPHNLGEEFRINYPQLTYGFDESFLNYFGSAGTAAVHAAFAILNGIPPTSQMTSNLTEFPNDAKRFNFQASALRLIDVKTAVLGAMIEQMGVASGERWSWALRGTRTFTVGGTSFTNYLVIQRNFDPVTWQPTPYVNGVLYTYTVQEFQNPTFADAVENTVDPLATGFTSLASIFGGLFGGGLGTGEYFDGLTRDDAGAIRYLLRSANYQYEGLANNASVTGSVVYVSDPFDPAGVGFLVTNAPVDVAFRSGIDAVRFVPHPYDHLLGFPVTLTNVYTDTYYTNGAFTSQPVERVLVQPDILITAQDLGVVQGDSPILFGRPTTAGWQNNDAINGSSPLAGPGVIQPPLGSSFFLTFSKLGPYFLNTAPNFVDELSASPGVIWGSFNGSSTPPIVFPQGYTVQDIEDQILNP